MCIIIDVNQFGNYLNRANAEMAPVQEWMEKPNSKIAYSPTAKLKAELYSNNRMRKRVHSIRQKGKLKLFDEEEVYAKQKKIENEGILRSNDSHIMALALVANVRVLISLDNALCEDFRLIARGNIYRNQNDGRLLTPDLCP